MATRAPAKKLATLGTLYEQAATMRAEIAALESQVKPLKEQHKELEARILASMIDSGTEQHRTADGAYSIKRSTVPHVLNWELVDKFILKEKSLDLLHRRLTATAWQARLDDGILVPGTESVLVTSLLWRGAK